MMYVDIFEQEDPLNCGLCPFAEDKVSELLPGDKGKLRTYCNKLSKDVLPGDIGSDGRLKDCPIKELPKKRSCNYYNFEGYNNGYDKGWNDCIDHLTGEGTVK